jgi:hypothetical protein
MHTSILFRCMGALVYLATIGAAIGQAVTSSPAISSSGQAQVSQAPAAAQADESGAAALAKARRALVVAGATPQQLQAWYQQNSAQFTAQTQRAEAVATASVLQLRLTNRQLRVPANASPTLKDFLAAQSSLANARAQIHNQLVAQAGTSGSALTFAQVSKMEEAEG